MSLSVEQVTTLLEDVLFESPELAQANAATWMAKIAGDSSLDSVSGLTVSLAASPEGSIVQQVERFYMGALGRNPAGWEAQYYVAIAEKGLTADQIAQGSTAVPQTVWDQISTDFAASPEFSKETSGSNAISLIYQNVLGRTASPDEIKYYQDLVAKGAQMSTLLQDFVNSPEYKSDVTTQVSQALQTLGTTAVPGTDTTTTPTPAPTPTTTPTPSPTPPSPGPTPAPSPSPDINVTSASGPVSVTGTTGTVTVNASGINSSAANVQVDGGTGVSITTNGTIAANATGGSINVGSVAAPTGAVTVIDNFYLTDTSGPGGVMPPAVTNAGDITVNGGGDISISATLSASHAALTAGIELDFGTITVNGGSATHAVTIGLPAFVLASTYEGAGTAAVLGVTGATAGPGVTGVIGVTGVTAIPGGSQQAGFYPANGVTITDAAASTHTTASNSITTLNLTNPGNVTFNGNALTTVNVTGGFSIGFPGGLTINNSAAGAATNTTLTVNADGAGGWITDTNNEITTLNLIASGAGGSSIAVADSGLTAIHVSGTQVVNIGGLDPTVLTSLSAITVSGGAGLIADISPFASVSDGHGHMIGASLITTSSTGTVTLKMDAGGSEMQSFTGGSGTDIVSTGADPTQYAPIAAGSGANNELILTATATNSYTLAGAGTYATGFTVLGIGDGDVNGGTIDLAGWSSHIQSIDVRGEDGQVNVTHFAGATIDFSNQYSYWSDFWGPPAIFSVSTNDTTGAADSLTVLVNGGVIEQLDVSDAAGNGIGTLNIIGNQVAWSYSTEIMTLVDTGLSVLNISGNVGTGIGSLSETATSLTVNNVATNLNAAGIGTLVDPALSSVTLTGTRDFSIVALNDSVTSLTLSNNGSGILKIGTIDDTSLTSLTLGANVALGQEASLSDEQSIGLQGGSTSGVTVSAPTDNAHIGITLTGATGTNTDNITLGNGNDYVVDSSATFGASVSITVGTGSNYLVLGNGATAAASTYAVILGAHSAATGIDALTVGTAGANFTSAANYVITGIQTGDTIALADTSSLTVINVVGGTTLTSLLVAASAAGDVTFGTIGGNTYVVETSAANAAAQNGSNTTVIELMGVHTVTSSASGVLTVG